MMRRSIVALLLTMLILPDHGLSQEQVLEEIVVTATKRDTALQDTPLAISVVSTDTLERLDIRDFNQFADRVPGLNLVEVGPGQTKLIIRGVSNTIGEATSSVYYDEIPVNGGPGTVGDSGVFEPAMNLFDVERIEVLRGPQGTLYGDSSMGGTVRIIYKKPHHDGFEGRVEGGFSSVSHGGIAYDAAGVVNLPLVEDVLAMRLVGYSRDSGGYIDNTFFDLEDINANVTSGGKFMLKYDPSERFSLLATAIVQRSDQDASNQFMPLQGFLSTIHEVRENMDDELDLYNLTANIAIGDSADLVLTGSLFERDLYREFAAEPIERFATGNLSRFSCARRNGLRFPVQMCTPAQMADHQAALGLFIPSSGEQPMQMKMVSYEARLSSNWESRWNYTVGVFHQTRDFNLTSNIPGHDPDGYIANPPNYAFRALTFEDTDQLSFFGEVSYDVSDRLTLTGGLRHFDIDRNNGGYTEVGFQPFNVPSGPVPAGMAKEDGTLFKLHIGYQLSDDFLIYGQGAEGFRSGGANRLLSPAIPPKFKSDSLVNYEFGVKTTLRDGRVVFNSAYSHIIWDDIQSAADDPNAPVSFTGNAGEATIDSLEIEVTAVSSRIDGLSYSGNVSYSNARLTEDQVLETNPFGAGRDGDDLPYVPDWTVGFSLEYARPIGGGALQAFGRVDLYWTDESNSAFNRNVPFDVMDSYSTVALRAGVDNGDDWGVDLFVTNVFDEDPHVYGTRGNFTKPGWDRWATIRPRAVGVSVHRNF